MLEYWLWLTTRRGLGRQGMHAALRRFGSPEAVFYADAEAYRGIEGLKNAEPLEDKDLTEPRRILSECHRKSIHILTWQDAAYPARLRSIDDPPLLLYYQGTLPDIDAEPVIAMVGTRHASLYGLQQGKMLGYQMGRLGAIVASGGADGVDTVCLTGALTAGGPVIAVLGCGVDVAYPAKNRGLFEDIRYHGCLISEFPPGTPPYPDNFPVRNRILSGISVGVVVVEAPKKSGALITASRALEQGRDVFALPANVGSPTSEGNLQLLKDGATLISEGADVMREYALLYPDRIAFQPPAVPMTLTAAETKAARPAKVAEERTFPKKVDKKDVDNLENRAYIDVQEISDNLSPDANQISIIRKKIVVLVMLPIAAIIIFTQRKLPEEDRSSQVPRKKALVLAAVIGLLGAQPLPMDEIIDRSQLPAARALAAITLLEVKQYIRRLPGKHFTLGEKR